APGAARGRRRVVGLVLLLVRGVRPHPRAPSFPRPLCTSGARVVETPVTGRGELPVSAWIETVTNGQAVAAARDARSGVGWESASLAQGVVTCCDGVSYSSARDACAVRPAALTCGSRADGRAVLGPAAQVLRRGRLSEDALSGKVRFPVSRLRGHWPQPERAPGPGAPEPQTARRGNARETSVRPRPRTRARNRAERLSPVVGTPGSPDSSGCRGFPASGVRQADHPRTHPHETFVARATLPPLSVWQRLGVLYALRRTSVVWLPGRNPRGRFGLRVRTDARGELLLATRRAASNQSVGGSR